MDQPSSHNQPVTQAHRPITATISTTQVTQVHPPSTDHHLLDFSMDPPTTIHHGIHHQIATMGSPLMASQVKLPENQLAPLQLAVAEKGPVVVSVDASPWTIYDGGAAGPSAWRGRGQEDITGDFGGSQVKLRWNFYELK